MKEVHLGLVSSMTMTMTKTFADVESGCMWNAEAFCDGLRVNAKRLVAVFTKLPGRRVRAVKWRRTLGARRGMIRLD
jgi:hypothetical protein